jgi:ABC-type multidrug transport system ATPase subunit
MPRGPGAQAAALAASGLSYALPGGIPLFEGLGFSLPKGSFLTVLGANGSGKSTLLDILAGLRAPFAGTVELGGLALGAKGQGPVLLPQDIDCFLLGATVGEEIMISLAGAPGRGGKGLSPSAGELAAGWGFGGRLDVPVADLSGGEKKRLALLGALSGGPPALLLDEPFAGLDWAGSRLLAESLAGLKAKGETIVMATHEPGLAKGFTDLWLLLSRDLGHSLTGDISELPGLLERYGLRPL